MEIAGLLIVGIIVSAVGAYIGIGLSELSEKIYDRWWHRKSRDKNYYKKRR